MIKTKYCRIQDVLDGMDNPQEVLQATLCSIFLKWEKWAKLSPVRPQIRQYQICPVIEIKMVVVDYWWLIKVTLVVAFGFLPPKIWWWGPTNENECILSGMHNHRWGGDTQNLLAGKKIWTLYNVRLWGCKNFLYP